jgi:hypothetical protein
MDTTEQMEIRIETVKENADGSADALIHFNAEGLKYLIQYAVIDILREHAKQNPIQQPESEKKVKLPNDTSKRKASTQAGIRRGTRHDTGGGG